MLDETRAWHHGRRLTRRARAGPALAFISADNVLRLPPCQVAIMLVGLAPDG